MKAIAIILLLAAAAFAQTPTPEYSETDDPPPIASPTPTPAAGMTLDEIRAKAKTLKVAGDIRTGYDKFRDIGYVGTKPENIVGDWEAIGTMMASTPRYGGGGVARLIYVSIVCPFAGTRMAETPTRCVLRFDATNAGHMFAKGSQRIYFVYDDERMSLDVTASDSDILIGGLEGLRVKESLAWEISRDEIAKLAAAKRVEILVAGNERPRQIKPKDRKGWQALLDVTAIEPGK